MVECLVCDGGLYLLVMEADVIGEVSVVMEVDLMCPT